MSFTGFLNFLVANSQFGFPKRAPAAPARTTFIPDPSFAIPGVLAAVTAVSAYEGVVPLAAVTGVLAAFLAFQVITDQFG